MVANTSPIFTLTPIIGATTISAAETSRTTPTSVGIVVTSATDGYRIERIRIKATATTAAGLVSIWLFNATGSVYTLIDEVVVTAITPSTTVASFAATWVPDGGAIVLPASPVYSLRASTSIAQAFTVTAFGGAY